MAVRVGINGFGRIGRLVFRVMAEKPQDYEIVAINDLSDAKHLALLLKYDSVHGQFAGTVEAGENALIVNGREIRITQEKDPANLPWKALKCQVALESTGFFTNKAALQKHIDAGAERVILSAPAKDKLDATIVLGVNDGTLKPGDRIVSNASCTTNCLAPVAKVLNDAIGIDKGFMTTIHSYTGDQPTLDTMHKDLYRARAAALNMIPTKTGAAAAVGLVLPELNGKLDGFAIRVPTINVSLVDLSFIAKRDTTVDEVNAILKTASEGALKGILTYQTEPLVSIDFNHNPNSSIVDTTFTRSVNPQMHKVLAWYDNEWGYSNRILDLIAHVANVKKGSLQHA